MKTFNFDVTLFDQEYREWKQKDIDKSRNNGLFWALYHAYSAHIPIALRPDDILNTVSSIWGNYVFINAEKFRDQFVEHEGKKELTYHSDGTFSEGRIHEFLSGMQELVWEDQKSGNTEWIEADFSTTNTEDRMVRSSALLASQQAYYEYGWTLSCGFPKVVLEGTDEDWDTLRDTLTRLPDLEDGDLRSWRVRLRKAVDAMISGDEAFWQTAITEEPYGSGGQSKVRGWATLFSPFNGNGKWHSEIDLDELINLSNKFPVHVNDNGNEFDIEVEAGPTRVTWLDEFIRPAAFVEISVMEEELV